QQAEPVLLQTEEFSSDIIMDGRKMILRHTIKIAASDRKLWTPDTPYLYYYSVRCGADEVAGYFALRTFSVEPDENGVARMCLNHRPYFQKGVLDQGYWPDGLYTAPSDSAMLYDIMKMKELGFSMLRKHLKIEPQRWYYHCDRLGMIVWQDMVNGGGRYRFWFVTYLATAFNMFKYRIRDNCHHLLARSDRRGREQFEQEMERTVRQLFGHPSIGTWVIFNEGWGQFDAVRMTEKMRALDSSRVIDSTSGWFDQGCGDLRSQHYYFFKLVLQWEKKRATVISELGGFPYRIEEHSFSDKVYGYHACNTQEELHAAYRHLMQDIIEPEIQKGLSATVYTQLSDVEEEVNGILTYDREVCKHADL
ncbi:MAG TPA: glycoside hydrolase family 2 TIM barrel-domain containing protein, partial [Lachnospiraceae bacterium]|nr:glycoside hydrolase family 2 TIM barrel-domain containing protein [Lachnospiraceae bacterium]